MPSGRIVNKEITPYQYITGRLAALETERAELLAARTACLQSWRAEGKTLRTIGELSGLSFARVKQILDAGK
tara:strand:- start:609 stop:824 length:216 start_codon:yes stop_codon:yes gene_type:complete